MGRSCTGQNNPKNEGLTFTQESFMLNVTVAVKDENLMPLVPFGYAQDML